MSRVASPVVFFQEGVDRRGGATVPQKAAPAEVQRREVRRVRGGAALQQLSPDVGELVKAALGASRLNPDRAAKTMGISLSLFLRQLQNVDNQHVSLQRLWLLPDAFWRELWVLVAKRRKLARVRRRVEFDFEGV